MRFKTNLTDRLRSNHPGRQGSGGATTADLAAADCKSGAGLPRATGLNVSPEERYQ
jgi:hypothetical protein